MAPATAPAAQTSAKPAAAFTALFALGSAKLDGTAMGVLHQAIQAAFTGRQSRITVVGHTDTSGTEALNKTLSLDRAKAVKAALVRMGAQAGGGSDLGRRRIRSRGPDPGRRGQCPEPSRGRDAASLTASATAGFAATATQASSLV